MALPILFIVLVSLRNYQSDPEYYTIAELRALYSSGNPKSWPRATIDSAVVGFQEIGVLPEMVFPSDNPYTEAKRELGKLLFYDPRLSASGQIACATCHDPQLGWGDGKKVSHGHNRQAGVRNSKSIINIGYAKKMFWDGRATTLEEQIRFPIEDPREMNTHMDSIVKKLNAISGYRQLFAEAFGNPTITKDNILKAIATFERTIVSRKSKFDKFISGDSKQYSDQEVLGLHLFRTKARCMNCHNSPYFSDDQFHNAGLTYYGRKYEDLGLYNITKKPEDVGKFRTPSLREVGRTAPYMHNGLFPHIRGVLNMYNVGMPNHGPKPANIKDPLYPTNSELLQPLNLNEEELQALEAFLMSITSVIYHEPEPEQLPQ